MRLPTVRSTFAVTAATTVMLLTAACGSGAETDSASTDTSSSSDSSDTGSADSDAYTDGSYEAEGSYSNPSGESTVKVELTLAGNEITDVVVTPEASNGTSKQYQIQFAGGIADEVVGKAINDIDVSKVAGSSLTSGGFNQAVDQIKGKAQA